jgi:hypothetical protein
LGWQYTFTGVKSVCLLSEETTDLTLTGTDVPFS